ncbi:MAG TPA: AAA family ATPase [Armatimonadota bacterium]|nr:AAA family ATPase [Armatimonadota bacterium]
MKTVALVTEKGGAGKSTIAVNLAVAAHRQGKAVAVIDIDPQGSAVLWSKCRKDDGMAVLSARANDLPRLLAEARKQGADLVVIDTAGREHLSADLAMENADVVLVPTRASMYDLAAGASTADKVRSARTKHAAFVLNDLPPRGTRAGEARAALAGLLPVAPVELHNLVAYSDALSAGLGVEEMEPNGKAAAEIQALYNWVETL